MARILVVEDERIVAFGLERSLGKLGYEVTGTAMNSAQALRLAETNRPDLVLMDIHLGSGPDGIETADRLSREQGLPVIYLTAYSEDATLQRAKATHPYGYLVKPFTERELHATIQVALERRKADLALQDREEKLQMALDAAEVSAWEFQPDTRRLWRSGRTDPLFGLDAHAIEESWDDFMRRVHPQDRDRVQATLGASVDPQVLMRIEFRGQHPDGHMPWLKLQARRQEVDGKPARIVGVIQDITERRRGEEQLRHASKVFESTQEAIFILDERRRIVTVNEAFCLITGFSAAEAMEHNLASLPALPPVGNHSFNLWAELEHQGAWQGELRGVRKSGEVYPAWLNLSRLQGADAAGEDHVVGVFADMTSLSQAEGQLRHLALYDHLTGLPNRLVALDRLEQALARSRRDRTLTAVVFVDLDHFKQVNDSFGHQAGDEVLQAAAGRLLECVRSEDTVARLGGDEFLLVLERLSNTDDVATIADKLLAHLERPIALTGREMFMSASLGISVFPHDAGSREDLIHAADTAMYAAKQRGRHGHAFYTPEMASRVTEYLAAERDLRRGIDEHEICVRYVPQVCLATGQVVGLEARPCWQHPQRGLMPAVDILPLAEESGLVTDLGRQVVIQACAQLAQWRGAGLPVPKITIDVSSRQLRHGGFPEFIAGQLAAAGVPPSCIELEIAESALQQADACTPALNELARMGVALAVDHFGVSHSNLGTLKKLPLNRCKIDRSLVRGVPADADDLAVVTALVAVARSLGLAASADGVETADQAATLRELGCLDAQGGFIGGEMAPGAVPAWLGAPTAPAAPA